MRYVPYHIRVDLRLKRAVRVIIRLLTTNIVDVYWTVSDQQTSTTTNVVDDTAYPSDSTPL